MKIRKWIDIFHLMCINQGKLKQIYKEVRKMSQAMDNLEAKAVVLQTTVDTVLVKIEELRQGQGENLDPRIDAVTAIVDGEINRLNAAIVP